MISIIIPTRNEEKEIGWTIRQFRQGLTDYPFEIIVSDDNSTDQTIERARPLADVVLVHEHRAGDTISQARNRGAKMAQYPYLVFLDSGVRIEEPNIFFKKAFRCFADDPKLAALTVNLRVFPETATLPDRFFFGLVDFFFMIFNNWLHLGGASGKFQMMKAEAFWKIGGYDENLVVAEDNEIFWRFNTVGRTRIERSLTGYHGGRRAHAIGWPRLLWSWLVNGASVLFFKKSVSKEWKPIR